MKKYMYQEKVYVSGKNICIRKKHICIRKMAADVDGSRHFSSLSRRAQ